MKQLLFFSVLFIISTNLNSQGWGQTQKIVAQDRHSEQEFAWSVAIQGNIAAIGARSDNEAAGAGGAVYMYQKDGSNNWIFTQKLMSLDARQFDRFGYSVAIDGNYMVIGARSQSYDENNANLVNTAGAAYIFEKDSNGNWSQVQKIVAPDRATSDVFGESVAISGDYAIVMAPLEDEDENGQNTLNAAGSGYVFERDSNGTWDFVQKLVISNRGEADTIGRDGSVSIDGNTIVIGVQLEDEDENNTNTVENTGAVFIFERDGSGVWNETQIIVASTRFIGDTFGSDVALDGDYMVVGSRLKDDPATDSGSAYVFQKIGGSWQEMQKLSPSNLDFDYRFGKTVYIEGNRLVVGAFNEELNGFSFAGAAYVYEKDSNDVWNQVARIGALDAEASDYFSYDIAISGDFVIVGAYREDEDENGQNPLSSSGSAYIFNANEPNTLSVLENEMNTTIRAYPNPVENILNLDFNKYSEIVNVRVIDMLGQEVIRKTYNNTRTIQLEFTPAKGLYIVEVLTGNQVQTIKVVRH